MIQNQADRDALENAVMAIDAVVRTAMLARTVLIDRLEADPVANPGSDRAATFGVEVRDLPSCDHEQTKIIPSMGDTVTSICYACNIILKDGVPQDA